MLVTFTTDAHADITMFGEVALTMLTMMGHSKTVPGAILAADVPTALNALKTAINNENVSPLIKDAEEENGDKVEVSLADRALPLIDLLTAAAEAKCNVMWK